MTATLTAFVAVPLTGIAPFSNDAPSTGDLTVSTGASICDERDRDDDAGRVLGGLAGLRVERADVELVPTAAEVDLGGPATLGVRRDAIRLGPAGVSMVIVAPGMDVPRSTYEVVSSVTSSTAVDGVVTSSVGGFA